MGQCIIMLEHEVLEEDEWHDNGPQDLITVTLCIQITIDKMQLCSLFVAYACPYHNPTMGRSVHNVDISKQSATQQSAICPVQLKPGFIREEHLPTEVGYDAKLQSGQDPGEDNEHADELPRDCLTVCAEIL
jgi:hypothetical protein